jgi:hypothetical protein
MPSRPDLRELASNVKEAFGDMDRETLLEILTFVVKEYVVEGPPPMLVHQAETLSDLKNCTFAQLISAMQTRFDFPELQMFVVDGEQVSVRVGGVVQPLIPGRQPAASEAPRPAAGVRVVEASVAQQRPAPSGFIDTRQPSAPAAAPATASPAASAPPPSRGLSVRGQPSGEGQPPAPAQPAPANQPTPAAAAPEEKKPDAGGDDASARFSLLELD